MKDKDIKDQRSVNEKRTYHRPRLFVYGDVNQLTRAQMVFSSQPLDGRTQMFGMFTIEWRS